MTPGPWRIATLVAVAIAISYLDRQTLPVAIAAIQREIPVSNTQFSYLQSAFLAAYALMYAGGGKLIDVLGTRTGFAVIMVGWSLACALHGLAGSFAMLAVCRFLLGMGEGGGFPAATKAVAEWFTPGQRSTAMGYINAGTAAGGILAPPLIAFIIGAAGWRPVFYITGLFGLLWTAWWWQQPPAPQAAADAPPAPPWLRLLGLRTVQGLVAAKFLSDAAWYFYLFWLPKYLYDVRGFDTKQVGYFAWIPFAAAGLGSLTGGWFSSWLLSRGVELGRARRYAMGASVALMPWAYFITQSPVELAIVIFSLAYFGQQSWSTIVMILPADLFPRSTVGAVAGLVGFGGALGGVAFGSLVGRMLDAGTGYGPVFALVSSLHVVAFLLVLALVRPVPSGALAARVQP